MMNLLDRAIISTNYLLGNVMAKNSDPTSSATSLLKKWTEYSKNIGWVVAGICIVIGGIMFMIPSDEQHRNAKKVIVSILIGAAILSVGPAVITAIQNGTA